MAEEVSSDGASPESLGCNSPTVSEFYNRFYELEERLAETQRRAEVWPSHEPRWRDNEIGEIARATGELNRCMELAGAAGIQSILNAKYGERLTPEIFHRAWNDLSEQTNSNFADLGALPLNGFAELLKQSQPKAESTNDSRDTWMYSQKKAGKSHSEIKALLKRDHPEWDQLDSEQAVGRAIDRYCDRQQLDKLRRKSK